LINFNEKQLETSNFNRLFSLLLDQNTKKLLPAQKLKKCHKMFDNISWMLKMAQAIVEAAVSDQKLWV
jgi:hypothetical protein